MLTNNLELGKITKCYNYSYSYKIFCLWDHTSADYQYILSKDNMVSRISVYKRTTNDGKSTIFVNFDGYPDDRITSLDAASWKNDNRIPFMFTKNEKEYRLFEEDLHVLIIGTAAQGIVKPIKHLTRNYSLIKGIEINPGVVSIMENEFLEYSGRAYEDISIDIIDARTFLKNTEDKYDLITLLNTYKTKNIGSIGEPDFLHTTDAIRDYFNHLTDDGFILLEERTINERAKFAVLRLINNFYTVLKEDDYENPQNHFFIYNWKPNQIKTSNDWYTMIVIKKSPLNKQDINYFERWLNYQYKREYISKVASQHTQLEYLPDKNLDTEYADFINSDNKKRGRVLLSLKKHKHDIVLSISDTGIGIAPNDLKHIFERFYKTDKSRSMYEGGSGLGLSIVKEIVDFHKGTIKINSDLGKGTKVIVSFYSW